MSKDPLYKYTRLENINSTLNNGIFASSPDALNDPYECRFSELNKMQRYRVVCLSRSRNQKLMWSHYADGHRGCAIKIVTPDDYGTDTCPLQRVRYIGKIDLYSKTDDIATHLFEKDGKWKKELEVRAVLCVDKPLPPHWKKQRNMYFYRATISQVDFGCFSHYDRHYLDALIAIRDYNTNHKKKIKVRKYKMSEKRFEFVLDENFDYIKEIANLVNAEE